MSSVLFLLLFLLPYISLSSFSSAPLTLLLCFQYSPSSFFYCLISPLPPFSSPLLLSSYVFTTLPPPLSIALYLYFSSFSSTLLLPFYVFSTLLPPLSIVLYLPLSSFYSLPSYSPFMPPNYVLFLFPFFFFSCALFCLYPSLRLISSISHVISIRLLIPLLPHPESMKKD